MAFVKRARCRLLCGVPQSPRAYLGTTSGWKAGWGVLALQDIWAVSPESITLVSLKAACPSVQSDERETPVLVTATVCSVSLVVVEPVTESTVVVVYVT